MMPNILQYPIAFFGLLRGGFIAVNTNPLYTTREMKHQFNDSNTKAIVILENFGANLEDIIKDTPIEKVIITSIGAMLGTIKGSIVNFAIRYVKRMVPSYKLDCLTFNQALSKGAKLEFKPVTTGKPDDTIAL